MIRYILEFLFCSGLFMAMYKLFIEGRVAHRLASLYLVVGAVLAAVIPALELPLYPAQTVVYELPVMTIQAEQPVGVISQAGVTHEVQVDWAYILSMVAWGVYLVVFALNIVRFVYKLWLIRRLRRYAQLTVYEAYTLAESKHVEEPFSFWRTIYLNFLFVGREREQVIIHELSHIRHHHTAERLMLELLRCVFWFNPFLWLAANALVEVHEWEADSDVLNQGYSVYEYRLIIFRQLFGCNPDITSGLKSQISKKRFLMMTNFRRGKLSFMRLGAAIPMVLAMILAFGAVRAEAVDVMPSTSMPVVQTLPEEEKSEVYISADGKILFNNEEVSLDELQHMLEKLHADKGAYAVLDIRTENETKMGAIEDVKLRARQSKVLRIRYVTPDKEVDKILPPPEGDPDAPYDVEISEDLKSRKVDFRNLRVTKNNLLMVCMNMSGQILTTRPDGQLGLVELAEVKDIVKQFIDNSESVNNSRKIKNPNYSSFTWQTIKRSTDGEVHYPVSDGIISIQTTRDTKADNYLALQAAIVEAYAELREELSHRIFSKPFASLEGYDRNYVLQAIPIRVSEADPRLPSEVSK